MRGFQFSRTKFDEFGEDLFGSNIFFTVFLGAQLSVTEIINSK